MADIYRNETIHLMEPLLIGLSSSERGSLLELAFELTSQSSGFRRSLPHGVMSALADLVRAMNCYYSNLIEGHDTHPVDIERSLKNDYSNNIEKRHLQLEAKAHITVQQWIDDGGLSEKATQVNSLCEMHQRFTELLPQELNWAELKSNDDKNSRYRVKVIPGQFRQNDVQVGQHIAISPDAIPRFLDRFQSVYSPLNKVETVMAAAAAHHRLLWIHPFLDGNGRTARLMSHSMLSESLDSGGVWSIARGLARNEDTYKSHLANCDMPRRNEFDGRGQLSELSLVNFTQFFLEICIDQVRFMESLVQPDLLRKRVLTWADEESSLNSLPKKGRVILEALLYRGELPKSEVAVLLGSSDRHARRIMNALMQYDVIKSEGPHAPWRLAFPATLAPRWMPGLFPDKAYSKMGD